MVLVTWFPQWGSTTERPTTRQITSRYPFSYNLSCCKDINLQQPINQRLSRLVGRHRKHVKHAINTLYEAISAASLSHVSKYTRLETLESPGSRCRLIYANLCMMPRDMFAYSYSPEIHFFSPYSSRVGFFPPSLSACLLFKRWWYWCLLPLVATVTCKSNCFPGSGEIDQLVKALAWWRWWQGYESCHYDKI